MNIFVIEPRDSGGMIHYAYQLSKALAKQGAKVTLVTAQNYELAGLPHNFTVRRQMKLWPLTDDPMLTKPPKNKIEIIWRKFLWNARRIFRGIRYLIEWIRLTRFLISEHPDIIQFGKIEFPFEAFFLNYMNKRGLTLTQICHEFELRESSNNPFSTLANKLYADVYKAFAAIFFHGESNRERFLSLFNAPANKLHLIPHGNEHIFVEISRPEKYKDHLLERYNINTENPVILFFGNITPSKGVPDLIKAFSRVAPKNKATRLIIAGLPSKYVNIGDLMQLTKNLGIADTTIFETRYIPLDEVGTFMSLATVVVYPYLSSTQSGTIQIAYAFGKPVIATNVGGLPEAVDDHKSGLLVPPEMPDRIADAILSIINSPEVASKMGAYAQKISTTRYAWEPIAANILEEYRNLKGSL